MFSINIIQTGSLCCEKGLNEQRVVTKSGSAVLYMKSSSSFFFYCQ